MTEAERVAELVSAGDADLKTGARYGETRGGFRATQYVMTEYRGTRPKSFEASKFTMPNGKP